MLTKLSQAFNISALTTALVLLFGISSVYAWTVPKLPPPDGNASAPINTSGTAQAKSGNFTSTGAISGWNLIAASTFQIASTAPAGYVLTTNGTGKASWLAPSGGNGTNVITGNTSVMSLPALSSGSYTITVSGTYLTCVDVPVSLLLDGTVVKTYSGDGVDSQECDQNTIQAEITNVAAGSHTFSMTSVSNIKQSDYLWTAYTDGTILNNVNSSGLGYGQTWQKFTPSQRTFGSTYINNTGKPIQVIATTGAPITVNSFGGTTLAVYVDNIFISMSAPALTYDFSGLTNDSYYYIVTPAFIVPNGSVYKISSTSLALPMRWLEVLPTYWSELR